MASYKGKEIMLNQEGVDAMCELAEALSGFKEDATAMSAALQKALDDCRDGLGIIGGTVEGIVNDYNSYMTRMSGRMDTISSLVSATAKRMQEYIDAHSGDDGHGPMGPNQKVLRR